MTASTSSSATACRGRKIRCVFDRVSGRNEEKPLPLEQGEIVLRQALDQVVIFKPYPNPQTLAAGRVTNVLRNKRSGWLTSPDWKSRTKQIHFTSAIFTETSLPPKSSTSACSLETKPTEEGNQKASPGSTFVR